METLALEKGCSFYSIIVVILPGVTNNVIRFSTTDYIPYPNIKKLAVPEVGINIMCCKIALTSN
jgi:hypothetical protein